MGFCDLKNKKGVPSSAHRSLLLLNWLNHLCCTNCTKALGLRPAGGMNVRAPRGDKTAKFETPHNNLQ